jgi:hypothetical protein
VSEAAGEHVRKRAIEIDNLANLKIQAAGQQGDQTQTGTLATVNSNGTFSTSSSGAINSILISTTEFVTVDNDSSTYPTIVVGKQ